MADTEPPGVVTQSQIYEQRCAEFRSLNGFFWQIPLIVMTLNGGLWFAVASLDLTAIARGSILLFAAIANLAMIITLWRLRSLMELLLTHIRAAEGTHEPKWGQVILWVFCTLFAVASIGAIVAAIWQGEIFKAKDQMPPQAHAGSAGSAHLSNTCGETKMTAPPSLEVCEPQEGLWRSMPN
jgi:hypothetical protein